MYTLPLLHDYGQDFQQDVFLEAHYNYQKFISAAHDGYAEACMQYSARKFKLKGYTLGVTSLHFFLAHEILPQ